jgi:hypothetical protein
MSIKTAIATCKNPLDRYRDFLGHAALTRLPLEFNWIDDARWSVAGSAGLSLSVSI